MLETPPLPLWERLRSHLETPLYYNAYYLIGTSLVRSLSGLPFWMLAAHLYTPHDVGVASALISAVTLSATVSSLGLDVALVRFLPTAEHDSNDLVNSSLSLVTLCSVLAAAAFALSLPVWSSSLAVVQRQPHFLLLFFLFTSVATLSILTDQVFVAHRAARFTFYKNAISGILKIPLPLLLVGLSGALALFLSVWTPVLLALAVSLLWFLPRIQPGYLPRPGLRKDLLRRVIRYALSNHVANLLGALPASLFPLMVVGVLGTETNAYFFAAWTLAQPLFMVSLALSFSLFAEGSQRTPPLAKLAASALRMSLLILVLSTTVVFLLGDRLLLVFGEPYSQHATTLLRLLSLAAFPVAVKLLGFATYRVRRQLSRIVALSALDSFLSVTLVYALMRSADLDGAGLGLLLSQVVVAAVMLCTGRRLGGETAEGGSRTWDDT